MAVIVKTGAVNIVEEIALRASPDATAIIADDEVLSFGELFARVEDVAAWLDFGTAISPRIGLACGNGIDYIVIALAILKAGGCLIPLADELTETERLEVISRTGMQSMILGKNGTWRRNEAVSFHPSINAAMIPLNGGSIENEAAFQALHPAFIRFSSGTTGRSKGVVLSHEKLLERIIAANAGLQIGPQDRVLWMLPMAHHFAVSIVLYLYFGATTVIGDSHLAAEVLAKAEATDATVIYGSPFHHSLLAADRGNFNWPQLRLAVSTAAPLPIATAEAFQKRFGKPLIQGLGIIEIGLPLLNFEGKNSASVGKPLAAFQVDLRDGELWIKGPGMFDAYLSPWQTLEEICDDGWFATGDLAEIDEEGFVYLKGRKKSVLIVGGMKVFPEEIEAVLNSHPAVQRSRAFGLEHPVLGTVPIAEVILHNAIPVLPKELIAKCREILSAYKVPVRIKFVDALPLTASGKIRRV